MRAYIFYPYYKIYSNYTAHPENANVYEHFCRNDRNNIFLVPMKASLSVLPRSFFFFLSPTSFFFFCERKGKKLAFTIQKETLKKK